MKYFIYTEAGEIGPFPMEKINRMFSKGEIRGHQLCRSENSDAKKRLDAVFKHFAPSQDVVAAARKNVANYNVNEGSGSMLIGVALILVPAYRMLMKGGNLLGLIPFLIVGIGLVVRGYRQNVRGTEALKKLQPPPPIEAPKESSPSAVEPPESPPKEPAGNQRNSAASESPTAADKSRQLEY